jgi:anthranilate 1,2-dioxygenase small subunit
MTGSIMEAIARSQAEYARCIDSDMLEKWPDFFADNCFYKVTTAAAHEEGLPAGIIYANSHGMLRDRVSALREASIYEKQTYRHLLGQPILIEEDAGLVRTETSFLIVRIMATGETDIFATGRYIDAYRTDNLPPKLAERIVVCDSSKVDTLLALPL